MRSSIWCLIVVISCSVKLAVCFVAPSIQRISLHTSLRSSLSEGPDSVAIVVEEKADDLWKTVIRGTSPSESSALNHAVSSCVPHMSLSEANDLINIGAVWAMMPLLTEEEILGQYDSLTPDSPFANTKFGDLPKGWGGGSVNINNDNNNINSSYKNNNEELRYRRILSPCILPASTPLRIYPHPRRFPTADLFSDPDRLLYTDTTFIVVDKPPMLPTQPDASNYYECAPHAVNEHLGPFYTIDKTLVQRPYLCHRIDSCVGGCLVLSKDKKGQQVFSEFQRQRKLKKLYLTLTSEPVPTGMHTHWMWRETNLRGNTGGPPCQFLSHEAPANRKAREQWIRCILEVTDCTPIDVPAHVLSGNNVKTESTTFYQSTIRLVTGRKHQVRAQLASLGCPILGDTLYEPISGLTLDQLDNEEAGEAMDAGVSKCAVPKQPIGLQAHAILFGGIRVKARTPWWGDGGD